MEPDGISILIAFAAGVLSFLSPCQLAVVPGFVSHLTRTASGEASSRARTLNHAAAFVLGFSLVFVVLGASVGLVGYLLYDYMPILRKVGGVALIVFGLQALGILRACEQIDSGPPKCPSVRASMQHTHATH